MLVRDDISSLSTSANLAGGLRIVGVSPASAPASPASSGGQGQAQVPGMVARRRQSVLGSITTAGRPERFGLSIQVQNVGFVAGKAQIVAGGGGADHHGQQRQYGVRERQWFR